MNSTVFTRPVRAGHLAERGRIPGELVRCVSDRIRTCGRRSQLTDLAL
ncbi:MAG: hypothetical protein LBV60_18050 [Streptomyces sp.]|nr:hypothetical protein [Streptomyces sp.]